jgi:hypothetical protein
LTALPVLAIGASSALVFTNRVELLKLAVILALWAAIVAAFVSVIYRRQSDVDQAQVRDLKLVYDLQLDREISARREYELTVESQLRRELASELRAQAADEVAALRAELAELRTNLEILFDTELTHRPALESDRTTVRGYSDWAHDSQSTPGDWVSSNRVTSVRPDEPSSRADDRSIIDVPEEPLVPPRQAAMDAAAVQADEAGEADQTAAESYPGSHWGRSEEDGWPRQERYEPQSHQSAQPQHEAPTPQPEPRHVPQPEPERPGWDATPAEAPQTTEWQPVGAEGQWRSPGTPGSNWVASPSDDVVDTADSAANGSTAVSALAPAATPPEQRSGRHASGAEPAVSRPREAEPGWQYGETGPAPATSPTPAPPARHRVIDPSADGDAPQSGGQSVADLLARLQTEPTGGGRRRDREE